MRNMLVTLLATLAWSSAAYAYTPEGTCEGWSTYGFWGGEALTVSTAQLQELQADGSWLTVDTAVDAQHNDPETTEFHLGSLWDVATFGTYRVVLYSVVYDHVPYGYTPSAEELAAWKSEWVYEFGPTVSTSFECTEPPVYSTEARTPGYWKNHVDVWGADTLTLGGTSYDAACLDGVLDMRTRGDIRVKLYHHLIAAKLNLLAGTDPAPIASTIADADAYLASVVVDCGSMTLGGEPPRGAEKDLVEALLTTLDLYDNNAL